MNILRVVKNQVLGVSYNKPNIKPNLSAVAHAVTNIYMKYSKMNSTESLHGTYFPVLQSLYLSQKYISVINGIFWKACRPFTPFHWNIITWSRYRIFHFCYMIASRKPCLYSLNVITRTVLQTCLGFGMGSIMIKHTCTAAKMTYNLNQMVYSISCTPNNITMQKKGTQRGEIHFYQLSSVNMLSDFHHDAK